MFLFNLFSLYSSLLLDYHLFICDLFQASLSPEQENEIKEDYVVLENLTPEDRHALLDEIFENHVSEPVRREITAKLTEHDLTNGWLHAYLNKHINNRNLRPHAMVLLARHSYVNNGFEEAKKPGQSREVSSNGRGGRSRSPGSFMFGDFRLSASALVDASPGQVVPLRDLLKPYSEQRKPARIVTEALVYLSQEFRSFADLENYFVQHGISPSRFRGLSLELKKIFDGEYVDRGWTAEHKVKEGTNQYLIKIVPVQGSDNDPVVSDLYANGLLL